MSAETPAGKEFLPTDDSIGAAYIAETRQTLNSSLQKITHCLEQLQEENVQWRPFPSANSIQNVMLHLCGNVRQWIMHGVGCSADIRDRPAEFSEQQAIPKEELLRQLRGTVEEADTVLVEFDLSRLTDQRVVQGFQSNMLSVIFDSVSHFVGHTHQIVYITRLRLGETYRFQWMPEGIDSATAGD